MRRFRYFLAIVLAFAMTIANVTPAMAAVQADTTLKISGLDQGDSVTFYKVIKWDGTTTDNGGWAKAAGFEALTATQLTEIVGKYAADGKTWENGSISYATANAISDMAETASAYTNSGNPATADANGEVTLSNVEPGLYMAIITPAPGSPYIYTPVFVAADYSQTSPNTNEWAVSLEDSYSPASVAKKSKPGVDKYTRVEGDQSWATHTDTESTADKLQGYVGKNVEFRVETTIPVFAKSLTNPRFVITDTVQAGLTLDTTSIKVNYKGTDYSAMDATVFKTFSAANGKIEIEFLSTEIASNVTAQDVVLTYKAIITDPALGNVTELDNDVIVQFTNGPDGQLGIDKDETNHYTFTIGGKIFGQEDKEWKTYELVKVGKDLNGNDVEKLVFIDEGSKYEKAALAGAKFALYTDSEMKNQIAECETGADGIITFEGLDAGVTYYLQEISAPDGYIKDSQQHTIFIEATYTEKTINESVDPKTGAVWDGTGDKPAGYVDVTYKVDTLDGYTVAVDGKVNAEYEFTSQGPSISEMTMDVVPSDIINTKGSELPSTGGIGTTIFYVVGGAMVISGIVMLITKRRLAKMGE